MESPAEKYYRAALERIEDANFLHNEGHYPFAMYASGLAVECLLRAFRMLKDPSFEERHDLWQLWKQTALADIRRESSYEKIHTLLGYVNARWRNSYRFAAVDEVRSLLRKSGLTRGLKGDLLKYHSKMLFEASREFLQLGGLRWERLNKKS